MKIDTKLPVLIIGAGSIGERHIQILSEYGFKNISVFRRRKSNSFRTINNLEIEVLNSWEQIEYRQFQFAIISNPSSMHASTAKKCLEKGMHILVEKPLSNEVKSLRSLQRIAKKEKLLVYVGYMMRFHEHVQKIKEFDEKKIYGNIISIESKWSEYLPDWHPWEDYRKSYAASKALGGGASLTLSHDIDLSLFISASKIKKHSGQKNYLGNLDINVDGAADILIKFTNGQTANIHLSFHQVKKERYLKVLFEKALIEVDFLDNSLLVLKNDRVKLKKYVIKHFDRNDLFISQLKFFISLIDDKKVDLYSESSKNIENSKKIIEICNNIK